jgi:hypothetical protein
MLIIYNFSSIYSLVPSFQCPLRDYIELIYLRWNIIYSSLLVLLILDHLQLNLTQAFSST